MPGVIVMPGLKDPVYVRNMPGQKDPAYVRNAAVRNTYVQDAAAGDAQETSPTATGVVDPPRSPRNANYTIVARLDAAHRTITASEQIVWRNITNRATGELQFHLYWNAWKNLQSTFLRERALSSRIRAAADDFSHIEVTSIVVDGQDLTAAKRFIQPDDRNAADETVMAVELPREAAPGAELEIELQWTARVPRPFARTGVVGNFFFIAQWFPKLGVLEDDGWNTHQFHASTEFFSDYGVYDVTLTVPRGWVLGATGVERDRRENNDGTTTHRYYQEDVHDFAWTTSPDFVIQRRRFTHATLPPVDIRLLLQPEHVTQADRHFRATVVALTRYGEWFGPYPYGHVTVVDPAWESDADGMEYPTLFTAGTQWLIPSLITPGGPEDVIVHEAGHQWFYGIVGTNEFEHAWMDEGINTYATGRALAADYTSYYEQRYFGGFVPWVFRDLPLRRETAFNRLDSFRARAESDDPSTPSYQYNPATGRYISYNKTALWLNTLENYLGWDVMQRALRTYVEQWQFRHPQPRDFFAAVTDTAGRDVGWFFDQVYRSSNAFDYAIDSLASERQDDGRYRTTVVVRRHGEAHFPVDVRIIFADGEQVTEHWHGRDRWKEYTFTRKARAESAAVDPERVLLLDINYTNNSRTLSPKAGEAATKWALKWMVWLEDALLAWVFFA
jgi:hypothetical protein